VNVPKHEFDFYLRSHLLGLIIARKIMILVCPSEAHPPFGSELNRAYPHNMLVVGPARSQTIYKSGDTLGLF
jgi:hypothetical protein